MIGASPSAPGRPVSRPGQVDPPCSSKGALPRSRVFPFPAVSRFSSKARLFASAATGGSTSDQGAASAGRSRVKVWEATGDEAAEHFVNNSCGDAVSGDGTAGPTSRSQAEQQSRPAEVEWSRQFLGHNINAVLFVPSPHRTKRRVNSASSPPQGDEDGSDGSSGSSRDDGDDTVLLIGTDKGMVAAADVSGRCGSKLLYAVYLGDAHAGGRSDGNLPNHSISNSVSGGPDASAAVTAMAGAAMGTPPSAVHDLRALPGRSDAVLALVGCMEGSTVCLLSVKDGSVLQEDALSKPYTLMATPSRLFLPPECLDGDGFDAHSQQLALLGCGSARKVHRETELDQSSRSGVLFLFDVPKRRQWLKLIGASSDSCCSLALHDKLAFAAACFHSGTPQQQTQLLVWQLPGRSGQSSEKAAAAKRKKVPPAAVTHFFEGVVQLLLPVAESSSEKRLVSAGTPDRPARGGSDVRQPKQMLIGLSRSSIIAIWGCFSTVTAGSAGASLTLELILQVNTAAHACTVSSLVNTKELCARPALAAGAQAPGVWYIEEGISEPHTQDAVKEDICQQRTARVQQELTLRVVRGSYAGPVFDSVVLPSYFDGSINNTDQQLYLPLVPSRSGKLSRGINGVIRPISAKELKKSTRKGLNQGEEMAAKEGGLNQEGGSAADVAHELPTVCLKRKIGAACSIEGPAVSEASGGKEGPTKSRKALGLSFSENMKGSAGEKSNVASILRQALVASDARLLESVLSTTAKDKKEVAAAVASLTPARALLLLQHLVQQQQNTPAASILKGPWIEELVKQHGVILGTTVAGREQLVLLLLQVEERRRAEAALVKVKGRVELLLQQMQRIQKLREQRRKDEVEAREPLVVHREHARS